LGGFNKILIRVIDNSVRAEDRKTDYWKCGSGKCWSKIQARKMSGLYLKHAENSASTMRQQNCRKICVKMNLPLVVGLFAAYSDCGRRKRKTIAPH